MQEKDFDYNVKIILVGISNVGKSNIVLRQVENRYDDQLLPTIGVNYFPQSKVINGKKVQMQIWDTMGQEKHWALTQAFYKNSLGIFIVYDVTSRQSFQKLDFFYQEVQNNSPKQAVVILLGNKSDLVQDRQVSPQEAQQWAQEKNIEFYEVSAKDDIDKKVNFVFQRILELIMEQLSKSENIEILKQTQKVKELQKKSIEQKNYKKSCC